MRRSRRFWLLALLTSLAITAACYAPVVGFGLTDKDTPLHIAAARVESPGDWVGLLSAELTGGRSPRDAHFYRPTVMLAYAALRAAFGWSAPGYHVFDLAVHALNGWLLGLFAAACAARAGLASPRRFGAVCGAVFLLHPVGVEVVPAIARNGDLLVTALLLGSLLALDGACEARARGARLGSAALGGRLAAFYALFALTLGAKEPGIVALGAAALYLAAVRRDAGRLVWGLGALAPCAAIALAYLVVRARVLGELLGGYGLEHGTWVMALTVANGLSLDLTVPGYAYRFDGPLAGLPLGIAIGLALAAALAVACLRAGSARAALRAPAVRLGLFSLGVCAGFAALFVATDVYDRRLLYPVVAFAIWLPALAVCGAADLLRRSPHRALAPAAAIGLLGALFLAQSPLVHRYDEWRSSGDAAYAVTEGIRDVWARLPDDSIVLVLNLPSSFALDPMRRVTGAGISSTNALAANGIRAWIEDQLDGKRIRVRAVGYHVYREPMAGFRHWGGVSKGWLLYRQPAGSDDFDEALAAFPQLRKVADPRRGVRLAYTRRPVPPNLYVLVVDGFRPLLLRADKLDGVPGAGRKADSGVGRRAADPRG